MNKRQQILSMPYFYCMSNGTFRQLLRAFILYKSRIIVAQNIGTYCMLTFLALTYACYEYVEARRADGLRPSVLLLPDSMTREKQHLDFLFVLAGT